MDLAPPDRLAVSRFRSPLAFTLIFTFYTDCLYLNRPGDGSYFPVDEAKLERLRAITMEIRVASEGGASLSRGVGMGDTTTDMDTEEDSSSEEDGHRLRAR